MGAKSFDAPALLEFLRTTESDMLYLVGDIIDGWKFNKRWYWTESYNEIIDTLVRKAKQGTKIIYLTGNHDESIRELPLLSRHLYAQELGIKIKDRTVHMLADGRKCLVMHGDQFDRKILNGPISKISDQFYEWILDLMGAHSDLAKPKIINDEGKLKRFSLAKYLSKHGQKALTLLNNFESSVYRCVKSQGLDGLICGHTHIPGIKHINDVLYANSGDWLRSGHHALVEHMHGDLELLNWPGTDEKPHATSDLFGSIAQSAAHPDKQYRAVTKRIVKEIQRIWPEKSRQKPPATIPLSRPSLFFQIKALIEKTCTRAENWAIPSPQQKKESS